MIYILTHYYSGDEPDTFSISDLCLIGTFTASVLLIAYIAAFIAFQIDLGARVLQAWKRLQGKPTLAENHLLYTLPYYLAITRSSCEVKYIHPLKALVDFKS